MTQSGNKILVVDPEKCTGCGICTLVCSFRHNNEYNPARALLSIIRDEKHGINIPVICQHCDTPLCMESCPSEAIYRDAETNAVCINQDNCIGCHQRGRPPDIDGINIPVICQHCDTPLCMESCPSEAIYRDAETNAVCINQDNCIGCHQCLVACPFGGIHIDPADGRTVKCDLCEGYAMCAQFCPRDALLYITPSDLTKRLREKGVKKAAEFLHVISGGAKR